ncbi:MAG: pyruvate kinase [Candidatus Taylorbacteria bacterium]|nr:pyruvate kinase [Candidatus Taylorbacteria bacterium]
MNNGKKTKIVCTIGPVTESEEKLTALVEAGMNVMRLNFSHGDFAEHQNRVDNLRKVIEKTGKTIATIQDLGGPKIRTGEFETTTVTLKVGQEFTFTTDKIVGNETRVSVNYPLLPKEVKVGGYILVDDGKKKFQITDIRGNEIVTRVIAGGITKGRRGVNLPGAYLSMSSITDKDRSDLEFGLRNKVDFIALSFVRKSSDIAELREILKREKSEAGIIAKIETPEALENIDEIINLSDAIMVARGDLAIEIPAEDVPMVQKMLIQKCNTLGKPVITATQMLESMIKSPIPTRAEVSDIANAIIDGTDALMLSEETTLGDFPVEAVKMMTRIALKLEKNNHITPQIIQYKNSNGITDIVSRAAVIASHDIGARFLVALTESGKTARMLARYHPAFQIIALTSNQVTARKLSMTFGCYPVIVPKFSTVIQIMDIVKKTATKYKIGAKDDKVVIVAGMPFGKTKETNMMLIETL